MNVPSVAEIEGMALGSALAATFAAAPRRARALAIRHTQVLLGRRTLQSSMAPGGDIHTTLRTEFGVSRAAVYRWCAAVADAPQDQWPALLLPGYRPTAQPTTVHPDAWQHLLSDYHRASQPAFDACYRRLLEMAPSRQWGALPSLRSLRRRYNREVSRSTKLLRRAGVEAFEKLLPTQTRSKRELQALQWVNSDGHRFDVMVQWPMRDGSPARIMRPTIVAWQDVYSGKILSWRLDENENVDVVRLAFADMVREYGIPEDATIDNGHAFASKQMTGLSLGRHRFKPMVDEPEGIYRALGVRPHFTLTYRGRSKPIERAWRDFCEDISKHPDCAGAYTGNAAHKKPEDYGTRAVPVAEFMALVGRQVALHNARPGRRSEVCAGRSFDQVFAESYADESRIIRRCTEAQLQWLLMPLEGVKVPRSGQAVIRLLGNAFFHEALLELRGHTVVVRFDPHNVHAGLYVFVAGELQPRCHATCIEATGFGDTDSARRTERGRKALVRAKKLEAAAMGTVPVHELSRELPASGDAGRRKSKRVVAVDFRPAHQPPAMAAARKALEGEDEDFAAEITRAARLRLNKELGLVAHK